MDEENKNTEENKIPEKEENNISGGEESKDSEESRQETEEKSLTEKKPVRRGRKKKVTAEISADEEKKEDADSNIKKAEEPPSVEEVHHKRRVRRKEPADSNYQISLINENLLKVKITTDKSIGIDCSVKDRKSKPPSVSEVQTNNILIHPKEDGYKQEVEVTITIDKTISGTAEEIHSEVTEETAEPGDVLTPNPEVAHLIQATGEEEKTEPTIEEILEEKLGRKNPYVLLRKRLRTNLKKGFIYSVTLFIICSIAVYSYFASKPKTLDAQEQVRLIVIQDLPEPKITIQEVEDPNKPPEEEVKDTEKRPIVPRNIGRTPKIKRPIQPVESKDTTTTALDDATKELDSLRKLAELNANQKDTALRTDTTATGYIIPDSLRNEFAKDGVPLKMWYPKNWKLIDSREVDKNLTTFEGVILTDTTAEENGTLTIFISLDNEEKNLKRDIFKPGFEMEDSLVTMFLKEPYKEARYVYYRFFVFGKTNKLYVNAQVKEPYFDRYRQIIEYVVKTIKI